MNYNDNPCGELSEGKQISTKEFEQLKSQILDVLRKDLSVDMTALRNREKALIIGALKNKYSLPILL